MPIERVEGTTSFLGGSLWHVRRVALAPIQGKLPVNPAAKRSPFRFFNFLMVVHPKLGSLGSKADSEAAERQLSLERGPD